MIRRILGPTLAILLLAVDLRAADRASVARARGLYNEGRYDDAIEMAALLRASPSDASAAALVIGRAQLERFRTLGNSLDLDAARDALQSVDMASLSPADQTELLIGFAETIYLEESY